MSCRGKTRKTLFGTNNGLEYLVPGLSITVPTEDDERGKELVLEELSAIGGSSYIFKATFGDLHVAAKCMQYKTNQKFAARVISHFRAEKHPVSELEVIQNEISVMESMKGRYVLELLGYSQYRNMMVLVLEFCPISLNKLFSHPMEPWSPRGRINYIRIFAMHLLCPIMSVLKKMHAQGLIHCDIKPNNILIDPNGIPKLTDFGLAVEMGTKRHRKMTGTVRGSLYFLDPFIVRGGEYTEMVDVFALGLTFGACISRAQIPDEIGANSYWPDIIKMYKEGSLKERNRWERTFKSRIEAEAGDVPDWKQCEKVVCNMVSFDPLRRPSIADVLDLPVFQWHFCEWEKYFAGEDLSVKFKALRNLTRMRLFDRSTSFSEEDLGEFDPEHLMEKC